MTLQELVGCQLVVGVPGMEATMEVVDHLRTIHAGGVIPFARNFRSKEQFGLLLAGLKQAVGREFLVMVDHEGGRVIRFSDGVTRFPDALTVGRTQQPEDVYRQGAVEAAELAELGIDVNLAPCLDVLMAGADPVIGDRSYGSDPARVAAFGIARIQGLQRHGLHACAKHFPGIGAVPKDPHQHLPTVEVDVEELRRTHLAPFQAAISAGVSTVMSSHVCYAKIRQMDSLPATFSPWCMRRLLRQELGFSGTVISDDLEMGALGELCPIGEAAVRAIEAGHDVLLVCSDFAAQRRVFDALCAAYRQGRLPVEALEQSVERIRGLRGKNK